MSARLTNEIKSIFNAANFDNLGSKNIDQSERTFSIVAGSYLLYKGLTSLRKHPFLGLQGAIAGGFMVYRGATGVCPLYKRLGKDTTDPEAINITEQITVNATKEKVYAFWRELSNLPKFMTHLKSVEEMDNNRSKWTANTPGDMVDIVWNAEITREKDGEYIGWQSVEGSMIDNAGKVEFKETLNGTGTELTVDINYFPPAGSIGRGIASIFNGMFEKMIREDIQGFKDYVEQEDFKQYAGLS
jgi:uncharacterized membrane protein